MAMLQDRVSKNLYRDGQWTHRYVRWKDIHIDRHLSIHSARGKVHPLPTTTTIDAMFHCFIQGADLASSNKLRVMYTNTKNVDTNELVVVHYGNTVTIKGSQIIINGQPGPQLPSRVNDLLVRQATSVLVAVEGGIDSFVGEIDTWLFVL